MPPAGRVTVTRVPDQVAVQQAKFKLLWLTPCLHMQELLDKCHPLGMFDSIATLAVASSMRELYRLVLVDTPLAPYFSESLSAGRQPHWSGVSRARVCLLTWSRVLAHWIEHGLFTLVLPRSSVVVGEDNQAAV